MSMSRIIAAMIDNRVPLDCNCRPKTIHGAGIQARASKVATTIAGRRIAEYLMLIATAQASAIASALSAVSRRPAHHVAIIDASMARVSGMSFLTIGA